MDISFLILTYNEAENLPRCLDALSWCDDVIIIDSGSTDETVKIAKDYGARVITRAFDNFANQRNFGIDEGQPKYDWIFHLDADEVLTPELTQRLQSFEPEAGIYGYNLPSKLMLGEQWLKRSGMYPSYQVRFGHKKYLRFKQVGHGQRESLAPEMVGILNEPYLHYNFSHGLERWFAKHIRYAKDEADEYAKRKDGHRVQQNLGETATASTTSGVIGFRRRLKDFAARLPPILRPTLRFIYIYFVRLGFLDGRAGLQYALMMASYEGIMAVFMMSKIDKT